MEKEKVKVTKAKKVMMAINIVVILCLIAMVVFICIYFKDAIKMLSNKKDKEILIEKISNSGIWGFLILLLIQIFQVVVAFIPGEVVEIAAGAMFGPFFGLCLCLVGLIIATIIIYYLVKWLGAPFAKLNISEKHSSRLKFLNDPDRSLILLFFIFLVPGIPKDIFIYVIPFTNIKLSHFIVVSSIARIPSILSSTFVGAAIFKENYVVAGIIMGVIFVFSVLGLIFNKKIYEWLNNFKKKKVEKVEVYVDEENDKN